MLSITNRRTGTKTLDELLMDTQVKCSGYMSYDVTGENASLSWQTLETSAI